MALSQRLNIFENAPLGDVLFFLAGNSNTFRIDGHVIPGSISFNKVALLFTAGPGGTTTYSATVSLGLYSLNGATLSIANSASGSISVSANSTFWLTLGTSATQDITPGNWYYGFISSTNGGSPAYLAIGNGNGEGGGAGGVLVRGVATATTNALPSSIETSVFRKQEASGWTTNDGRMPYILIAA